MDILVLHGMGIKKAWVASWEDVELIFPKYDKNNNYIVHNCIYDVPACLKSYPFDAVLMTSTFMDWVKRNPLNHKWMRQYEFLKNMPSMKIVFSQDDYWLSEIRDEFCVEYNVSLLLPVCAKDKWDELYPKYLSSGGKLEQGYTTYVTDYMKSLKQHELRWSDREFDVVYRASGAPTFPNKFGEIKANIGNYFEKALTAKNFLKTDISTSKEKFIKGTDWYTFLANSKSVLGSNSGSSVNVRNFDIVSKIEKAKKEYSNISMSDLEKLCIASEDRDKNFTGISPRNIEAAMLGTLQILVPGEYGGFLKSGIHYIPLKEDGSNACEIEEQLQDEGYCKRIIENCRNALLNIEALDANKFLERILKEIYENCDGKPKSSPKFFSALKRQYYWSIKILTVKYKLLKSVAFLKFFKKLINW